MSTVGPQELERGTNLAEIVATSKPAAAVFHGSVSSHFSFGCAQVYRLTPAYILDLVLNILQYSSVTAEEDVDLKARVLKSWQSDSGALPQRAPSLLGHLCCTVSFQ